MTRASPDLLELARKEFADQEAAGAAVQRTVQFILTLGTLTTTASVSLLRPAILSRFPRVDAVAFFVCAAAYWVCIAMALRRVAQVLWVQKAVVPKALDDFLRWRDARSSEIVRTSGDYSEAEALEYATGEMLRAMTDQYADAAGVNRLVNICRQRFVAKSTIWLIASAVALACQSLCYIVFLYVEFRNGRF